MKYQSGVDFGCSTHGLHRHTVDYKKYIKGVIVSSTTNAPIHGSNILRAFILRRPNCSRPRH